MSGLGWWSLGLCVAGGLVGWGSLRAWRPGRRGGGRVSRGLLWVSRLILLASVVVCVVAFLRAR